MEEEEKIKELYMNPKTGLTNAQTFAKHNKLPLRATKKVLKELEPFTLNKYTRENYPRRKVIVNHIDEVWSMDLMDVHQHSNENNGVKFLMVVVDSMSKYVWVEAMKDKTANECMNAFKNILSKSHRKPEKLWIDEEAGFLSKNFQKLLDDNGITHYHTFTQFGSVFAERFIRTLRLRLSRLADVRGDYKYINDLPSIIELYNDTPHTTTKIKPSQFKESDEADMVKTYDPY